MEIVKKVVGAIIAIYALLVIGAALLDLPDDKPEPGTAMSYDLSEAYDTRPVQTGWSDEWKMRELEDQMDRMAEDHRRDMACMQSGSAFC